MGDVNKLGDRKDNLSSLSDSIKGSAEKVSFANSALAENKEAKFVKAGIDKVSANMDGTGATTSTNSDNQNGHTSVPSKAVDVFLEAQNVKLKKLKREEKRELKDLNKEQRGAQGNNRKARQEMKLNKGRGNNYFEDSQKEDIKKLDSQNQQSRELKRRVSDAKNNKNSRVEHSSNDETDKFNKRDRSIKESSKTTKATNKYEKLGGKQDKFNSSNSLKKIRGGSEKALEKKGKKEATKIAKKKALEQKAKKEAAKKVAAQFATKGAATAASSTIMVPVIIVVLILLIILMLIMVAGAGAGGAAGGAISSSVNNSTSSTAEERQVYTVLMSYFGNNEKAVLGIMCNIMHESGFKTSNLEDTTNTYWGISDEEYTESINNGSLTLEKFKDGSYLGDHENDALFTNGSEDIGFAGYGLCQYTAPEKKEGLFNFATSWFAEDGQGAGQDFNIADATMQANYLTEMLDNEYSGLADSLRNAATVEDAVYVWFIGYEQPYYAESEIETGRAISDYRASYAGNISASCNSLAGGVNFSALEGTYIFQTCSGPCVTCSVANMIKRYCYMKGDSNWDQITPDLITDDGESLHDDIVCEGTSFCGWAAFDSAGNVHKQTTHGWSPACNDTVNIHGISCTWTYVGGCPTKDELIALLAQHPEGIAVTSEYEKSSGGTGAHGKTITRYDATTDMFYCVDPGAWGSSTIYEPAANAGGRNEMPLVNSQCWQDISRIIYYRYITGD